MESTNSPTPSTTTDLKDQALTSSEPETTSLPPVTLDELDDQVLEEIVGGINTIFSYNCGGDL